MSKEDPFRLRPLWDSLIDVYKEYAKICERHNLRYYLCAGTVLGALRHGGFIPWDDDFDVIMPRRDYEIFLHVAPDELPEKLKIVDRHNARFDGLFAKVQLCDADKVLSIERTLGCTLSNGIYVDVFPLDGYPDTRSGVLFTTVFEWAWFYYYRFLTRTMRPPARTFLGKLATCFGMFFAPMFSFRGRMEMIDLADWYVKRMPFRDDRMSAAGGCLLGRYERIMPAGIWGKPRMLSFEGVAMPVPEKAEELMRNFYGDYMKLPPAEKRVSTHRKDGFHYDWWLGPTKV